MTFSGLRGESSTRVFPPPRRDDWRLNAHSSGSGENHHFFVTYIAPGKRWYRLNITVKKPLPSDTAYYTTGTIIWEAAARSLVEASWAIHDRVEGMLKYCLFKDTTTCLYIGADSRGGLHIQWSRDVQETAHLARLQPYFDGLGHISTTTRSKYVEHLSGYLYRVRRNGRFYLFHQLPDLQKLEGFFSDAVYLCRTFSCPYMNNLAGIVYDSERQHVRGVLTKDTQHLRSLYDILSRSDRVEDRIPVSVRLRWAVQVVTTLVALSDVASSKHGNLTLKSIFLVPPEEEPNTQSPTFHVRVNPLTE